MCKEIPLILVNKVVDPKRIIGKNGGPKEEERLKGSLTKKIILWLSKLSIERCSLQFNCPFIPITSSIQMRKR
jgi:hypothetical protein